MLMNIASDISLYKYSIEVFYFSSDRYKIDCFDKKEITQFHFLKCTMIFCQAFKNNNFYKIGAET